LEDEGDGESISNSKKPDQGLLIDPSNRNPLTGSLMPSEKMKLVQLLERWEEPERESVARVRTITKPAVGNLRTYLVKN
jgi:hypothetical protein